MRKERAFLILLLAASVLAPIFFFAAKFSSLDEEGGFADDISAAATKEHSNAEPLHVESAEQGEWETVKEPVREVLEDGAVDGNKMIKSVVSGSGRSAGDLPVANGVRMVDGVGVGVGILKNATSLTSAKDKLNRTSDAATSALRGPILIDEKIRDMKDQLIMAKAYLHFSSPNSNSHLVRELKQRIKEVERVIGRANKDSDLSRGALQRKRAMDATLSKAGRIFPDCPTMASKLRSMTHSTEAQLKAQMNQASYLMQLAGRTFPKGFHCISMRLTAEYFSMQPAELELSTQERVQDSNLYHYAIFSDNVLACAVVINSTIRASKEEEKIVFHIVTDALNYPVMKMWFLMNPPGKAAVSVENMEDFKWYNSSYISAAAQPGIKDPRFRSELNYLRFYLPQIFPYLDKVLLLDHDVVVLKDLSEMWKIKMNGKVNGAVEMCKVHESSLRLEKLVDFSNPDISANFKPQTCLWAFGMNIFDLQEWRRQGLTRIYHRWLQLSKRRHILKAGSLPLGQLTFYNNTLALERHWHIHGLGYDPNIGRGEIERAAVIHYDGIMKPWLEIGIAKYKGYWTRFLNYDTPYMLQCNIHP